MPSFGKSGWGVVVSASFAVALLFFSPPPMWRPLAAFSSWWLLAVAVVGWTMAHVPWFGQLRGSQRGTNPMMTAAIFITCGVIGVIAWRLVEPIQAPVTPDAPPAVVIPPQPVSPPTSAPKGEGKVEQVVPKQETAPKVSDETKNQPTFQKNTPGPTIHINQNTQGGPAAVTTGSNSPR